MKNKHRFKISQTQNFLNGNDVHDINHNQDNSSFADDLTQSINELVTLFQNNTYFSVFAKTRATFLSLLATLKTYCKDAYNQAGQATLDYNPNKSLDLFNTQQLLSSSRAIIKIGQTNKLDKGAINQFLIQVKTAIHQIFQYAQSIYDPSGGANNDNWNKINSLLNTLLAMTDEVTNTVSDPTFTYEKANTYVPASTPSGVNESVVS